MTIIFWYTLGAGSRQCCRYTVGTPKFPLTRVSTSIQGIWCIGSIAYIRHPKYIKKHINTLAWWPKSRLQEDAVRIPFKVLVFCCMWCCRSGWLSSCCSWKRSCCCFRLLSIAARFCSCSRRCSSLASSFWSWIFPGGSTVLGTGVGLASFCRAIDIHFRRPLGKELTCQSLRRGSHKKIFSEKYCYSPFYSETRLGGYCRSSQPHYGKMSLQQSETDYLVILKKSSTKALSADCRSIVGRLSAVCWPTITRSCSRHEVKDGAPLTSSETVGSLSVILSVPYFVFFLTCR